MDKEECFVLGKIVKKHGFRGEFIVKIDSDYPEDYEDMDSFFVEQDGVLVPYLIEKSSLNGEFMKVKLENIDSEIQLERLLKKNIYLPKECLSELEEDEFYYHDVIDFSVYDKERGFIGNLKRVNSNGIQDIFEIEYEGKIILIPIVDDILKKIDKNKKEIHIISPKGLVDFYLGL